MKTATFSLIIAISVAILAVFQFNKYQKFTLNAQLNLNKLENEVNTKLEGMNHKLEGLNQSFTKLKDQEQVIVTRTLEPTWKMAEIEYSLYLAAARLKGARDIKGAIDLLTLTQEKISNLNDPSLVPLSEALLKDLEALYSIPLPHLEELWIKVSTLIEQASKLSPRSIVFNNEKEATRPEANPVTHTNAWKQKFLTSFQEIKDLIKIRHHSKPVEPLLSETEQVMITTTLCSLLEQVRFAILTKESVIYQHVLQDAENLLTSYYDETDQNVKNLKQSLNELLKINLRPELPTITSLEHLNTVR